MRWRAKGGDGIGSLRGNEPPRQQDPEFEDERESALPNDALKER